MDFATMGTIASYIRQKNLKFATDYKLKTGQRMADAEGNLEFVESTTEDQLVESKNKSDGEIRAARLASIRQKLASGRKISNEEMSYLQQREPRTYKKAKRADEAREELKSELKKAKTKQEAKQAVTEAMIKASAEASADIAANKSESGSNDLNSADQNINFISVDGVESAVNSVAEKDLDNAEFQNADEKEDFTSGTEDSEGEINFSKQANKITAYDPNDDDSDTPQEIMERFVMTIRALEAEWAQFTKSKEYDELPNDSREEELLNKISKNKYKNSFYAPSSKVWSAVTAYRKSMMYKDAQIIAEVE